MSARDDYPLLLLRWAGDTTTVDRRIEQHEAMCDEIDRLRDENKAMRSETCHFCEPA